MPGFGDWLAFGDTESDRDSVIEDFLSRGVRSIFDPFGYNSEDEEDKIKKVIRHAEGLAGAPKRAVDVIARENSGLPVMDESQTAGNILANSIFPGEDEEVSIPARIIRNLGGVDPIADTKVGNRVLRKGTQKVADLALDPTIAASAPVALEKTAAGEALPVLGKLAAGYFGGKSVEGGAQEIGENIDADLPVEDKIANIGGGLFDIGLGGYLASHARPEKSTVRESGIQDYNLKYQRPLENQIPVPEMADFPVNLDYALNTIANDAISAVSGEKLPQAILDARNQLPEVHPDFERLWRVEGKSAVDAGGAGGKSGGNWFERNLGAYTTPDTLPSDILHVDVPKRRLEQLAADPNASEFQLPEGYVAQAKRLAETGKGVRDIEPKEVPITLDEELPSLYVRDYLLGDGNPASQRGAVGDIGPLNKFEGSQYKKYGPGWRDKQSPEEAAFHQKLKSGEGSFESINPERASEEPVYSAEPESLPEENQAFDRIVQRPDGSTIRIQNLDNDTIRVTHTRSDGSILSVREGADFDSMQEINDVIDLDSELPVQDLRDADIERNRGFAEQVREQDIRDRAVGSEIAGNEFRNTGQQIREGERLSREQFKEKRRLEKLAREKELSETDQFLKAQLEVDKLAKKIEKAQEKEKKSLGITQDPNLPLESDTFWQGFEKLDTKSKVNEMANIIRSMRSSGDLPLARQGRIISLNDPKAAVNALKAAKRTLFSKAEFDQLHQEIASDPVYNQYKGYGDKFVPDIPGVTGLKEEAFPSSLAEKIPGVGKNWIAPSDRAYTSVMNSLRLENWKKDVARLEKKGITIERNPEAYRDLARVTNLISFRGDTSKPWMKAAAGSKTLGNILYSPRNKGSQYQILRQMLWSDLSTKGGLASPRFQLKKKVAQTWAVNTAVYGSLVSSGIATMETDPASSDFLKFKIGNQRWNPWLGTNQILRAAYLVHTEKAKSLSGRESRISGGEVAAKEVRKSLAPAPGLFWDIYSGKNVAGEKSREKTDNWEKQVYDSAVYAFRNGLTPMSAENWIKAYEQSGLAGLSAVSLAGAAGENVDVYDEPEAKPEPKKRKRERVVYDF